MKTNFEERVSNATNLLDVLLILRDKTMRDTHVATLAYIDSIVQEYDQSTGYGIAKCRPFPLAQGQAEYSIQAYWLGSDSAPSKGDKALVVFCDMNFISNLNAVDAKQREAIDDELHTMKFAVIIAQPSLSLSLAEKESILDFGD